MIVVISSDETLANAAGEALDKILDGGVQSFREDEDQATMLSPLELAKLKILLEDRARKKSTPTMRRLV